MSLARGDRRLGELLAGIGARYWRDGERVFIEINSSSFSLIDLGRDVLEALLGDDFEVLVVVFDNNYYFYYTRSDIEKALSVLREKEE